MAAVARPPRLEQTDPVLIACANVAGLFLARGIVRGREMAIRTALGAGGSRLVRQLLTESVALSVVSACGGLLLAAPALQALIAFGPHDLPRLDEARLNPRNDPNDSLKSVMGGTSQSRRLRAGDGITAAAGPIFSRSTATISPMAGRLVPTVCECARVVLPPAM